MRNCIYILLIVATAFVAGCKKSETSDLINPYNKLKLFDDTLGFPTPYFERMAAGNNRVYMAYVHGDGFALFGVKTKIQILVADNEGRLIKHDSLPGGILINALVAHNDETFSVVAYDGIQQNNIVYLFHYGNNGNLIAADSLLLPADNSLYAACRSQGSNILITTSGTNSNNILECDANGNMLWIKQTSIAYYQPILLTNDGGYMFQFYLYDSTITLHKVNGNGDSLWTKNYSMGFSGNPYLMLTDMDGNYFVNVSTNASTNSYLIEPSFIYKINKDGDSVSYTQNTEQLSFYYPNATLQRDDGNILLLASSSTGYPGGVMTINSSGAANTIYRVFDKNMNLLQKGTLQSQSIDFFNAACKTSDGKIACFGMIQSYGKSYFKPALIFLN